MAFFSGQDLKTLQVEGADTNCFVSLIVDTKGEYVAAITRRIKETSEVTVKSLGTSYEFFGEGSVTTDEDPMSEKTEIVDEEIIQYFFLDVEIERVNNSLEYLDKRFDEITKAKAEAEKKKVVDTGKYRIPTASNYQYNGISVKQQPKELTLWDTHPVEEEWGSDFDWDTEKIQTTYYKPDSNDIKAALAKMLSCSLIVDPKKFDMKQWIKRNMDKVYKAIFDEDSFKDWCDFIVEFLIYRIVYNEDGKYSPDEITIGVSSAMLKELEPYAKENIFVNHYCKIIERYTF